MKLGRFLLRVVIGGLFIGHGTQKLFGWFGGPGLEGAGQMMGSLRLHPPKENARLAGLAEAGGGTLLVLGLATPLAAASVMGVMITAIRTVHAKNGPWNSSGGYEYNLVLIAALLGLVDGGPGKWSMDRALGIHDTGLLWALLSLGTAATASALTVSRGNREADKAEQAERHEQAEVTPIVGTDES